MPYQITTATKKLAKLNKRVRGVAGGTGASKTISILLLLIDKYQRETGLTGSIVAESVPHLKRGALRDFLNIMQQHNYYDVGMHNKSDSIYNFETGSRLEFFAADEASKLRGGRRDDLYINEANNVSYSSYNELEIRTRDTVWLDWNPVTTFWFYEELLGQHDDLEHITLTYRDNEALDQRIVDSIERRKLTNPEWYKVYGLGQLGKLEGNIYQNWEILGSEQVPDGAELLRHGVDFGYTNDPSAIGSIYKWNDGFVIDEVAYATGLSNRNIADILGKLEVALTIADSAEPKSIDEIKSYGIWINGSTKGAGSVNQGIQLVQDQKLYFTKRSTNFIKDFRNYRWKLDKSDKPLNVPHHEFSHSPDMVRYVITDVLGGTLLDVNDILL